MFDLFLAAWKKFFDISIKNIRSPVQFSAPQFSQMHSTNPQLPIDTNFDFPTPFLPIIFAKKHRQQIWRDQHIRLPTHEYVHVLGVTDFAYPISLVKADIKNVRSDSLCRSKDIY